jgi:hypothetical protein
MNATMRGFVFQSGAGVGKDARHLRQKPVDEHIGRFARGIDGGVADAELAANLIGPGSAGQFRVGDQPGCAMSGHLELRHHADAARPCVSHNLPRVLLGVEEPVGAFGGECGIELALHAEALVFGQVPVEYVELHGGHAIQGVLQNVHGLEVPSAVDHQAAPAESRRVMNGDSRDKVTAALGLHQLDEGFQAMQRALLGRGIDLCACAGDAQRVALVLVDGLYRRGCVLHLDHQPGLSGHAAAGVTQPGLHLDAPHGAADRIVEPCVGDSRNLDSESGIERQPAGTQGNLRGLRHQVVLELRLRRARHARNRNCQCCRRAESQSCQGVHLMVRS